MKTIRVTACAALAVIFPVTVFSQATPAPVSPSPLGPKATAAPKGPHLEIRGVAMPSDAAARGGTQLDLKLTVTVRNLGTAAGSYVLVADLQPLSRETPRVGPFRAEPGATMRVPFNLRALLENAGMQGDAFPITIRLLLDGREVHRHRFTVPYRVATTALPMKQPETAGLGAPARRTATPNLEVMSPTVGRELAVVTKWVRDRDEALPEHQTGGELTVVVPVRNTMADPYGVVRETPSTRWGYPATLEFRLQQGTPESGFTALTGASGGSVSVPGNLVAGAVQSVRWQFWSTAIRPGFWYTVHTELRSAADTDSTDNAYEVTFMYDSHGDLVSQRAARARATVRAGLVRPGS